MYIDQFEFPWFGGYLNIVGISVIHVFFGALIARLMHGQRKDPYQTHEDRDRQIELGVKSLVWVGMAATIFVSLEIGLHALEMQSLSPTTTCLYLQLLALVCFREFRIQNVDFDVYRVEAAAG